MQVKLTLDSDARGHGDLTLTVGDCVWQCDSYYLALDQNILGRREDAAKVRRVLHAMLTNWRAAIRGLADGETAYLPYDFSDQGTAWLSCQLTNDEVVVRHGWASVEGWSISPSGPIANLGRPRGFNPDDGAWRMSLERLLAGIDASIADAG